MSTLASTAIPMVSTIPARPGKVITIWKAADTPNKKNKLTQVVIHYKSVTNYTKVSYNVKNGAQLLSRMKLSLLKILKKC